MPSRDLLAAVAAALSLLTGSTAVAAVVTFANPLNVDSTSATGTSFAYAGTLTGNDTLSLTAAGDPCLQATAIYCTNAAGVIVVAGSTGVGGASTNPSNGTTFGSLLLTIGGVTEQIFSTNAANGFGSASPPTSLFLPSTTLSALGFGSFSLVNPVLTFTVSDTLRTDNVGSFVLTQAAAQGAPEPASIALFGLGVSVAMLATRRRRSR